jgi:hypothetical protein
MPLRQKLPCSKPASAKTKDTLSFFGDPTRIAEESQL